jgi:phosphatidylglycerophosphate synthase
MAPAFKEAKRELNGLTAAGEKKVLLWLAARLPEWVHPDHLTLLGLVAMLGAGAAYALSARSAWWLLAVGVFLVLNWFGDSLDGTLARFRQKLRPRYGFYVDHAVDALGALFVLSGLALSGLMSERIAWALLAVYYLMSINIYLATYTRGVFQMSSGPFGGTELRLLLMMANAAVLGWPTVHLLGREWLVFDLIGIVGVAGLVVALVRSGAANTRFLYELERVDHGPSADGAGTVLAKAAAVGGTQLQALIGSRRPTPQVVTPGMPPAVR